MKHKKHKHKLETRKREISDTYCIQPKCKFNGQIAAQGVCFDKPETAEVRVFKTVLGAWRRVAGGNEKAPLQK